MLIYLKEILSDIYNMLNPEIHLAKKDIYASSEAQKYILPFYNKKELIEYVSEFYKDNIEYWNKKDNKRFLTDYYFKDSKLQKAWMTENEEFIELMSEADKAAETADYYFSNSNGFIFKRLYEKDFIDKTILPDVLDSIMDYYERLLSDNDKDYKYQLINNYEQKNESIDVVNIKRNLINKRLDFLHESIMNMDLNISDEGKRRIDEFVIGKLQINKDIDSNNGEIFPYSNLLLSIDESDYSLEIINIISKAIVGSDEKCAFFNDESWKVRSIDKNKLREFDEKIRKNKLICVTSFKTHPEVNYETAATGSALTEQMDIAKNFKFMWSLVIKSAQINPGKPFVIVTNQYVWESFRNNTELYYRTFRHHVRCAPLTSEQVYKRCIYLLKEDKSFKFSDDFEIELKKYMDAVYDEAELKGTMFAKDLRNRVYSLYYAKIRDEKIITSECIPKYNADVQTPEMIIESLKEMVGMEKVAEAVKNIYSDLLYEKNEIKKSGKKKQKPKPMHMLFTGNPGTGKTTIARKMGDLFFSMGLIKKRKLVETKPTEIMSGWRNVSANKMEQKIQEAEGGVLFIDEAYGFINGDESGRQALEKLMTEMTNNPDRIIVIMAGYEEEMNALMAINSGFSSRFTFKIKFDDYSVDALKEIFNQWLKEDGFELDSEAEQFLEDSIYKKRAEKFFGNARDVRNIYDEVKRNWTRRMLDKSFDEKIFKAEDFESIVPKRDNYETNYDIGDMIGLDNIKKKIEEFKNQVIYQKYLKERGLKLLDFSMHMIFTGNPGTGKTTVAKLIARELYSIGILKTDKLVIAEKKDLVSGYVGQTPSKTAEIIEKAKDGILFIDEAYSLNDDYGSENRGHGHEAIETLITAMEEKKDSLVVIFAGYTNEMRDFLNINPGISSRIGYTFDFEDYKPDELVEIYKRKMSGMGFKTSDAAIKKIHDIMYFFSSVPNFGNGRFVDHVIHQILLKRAGRFDINNAKDYRNIIVRDIPTHEEIIETAANKSELYDPTKISKEENMKTAIHECGHAVVMYVTGLETKADDIKHYIPKSISAKGKVGSLGRVELPERTGNMSEIDMRNEIAILLAGRNAERVFYGYNSTGVSSDFKRAKRNAENMIKVYAMGEIGKTTSMSILKDEDIRSTRIIEEKKDFIEYLADKLLNDKQINGEVTGDEFVKMYKDFYKK